MMRRTFFLLLLAAAIAAPALAPAPARAAQILALVATLESNSVRQGEPIDVLLALENRSAKKVKVQFQERDAQERPLKFPAGLTVRVLDESSRAVTQNDVSRDDWWSAHMSMPKVMFARKASRNQLSIKAGDKVERHVLLEEVLAGRDGLADGLPAGRYTVQFAMNGVLSNELQLEVTL